MTIWGFSIIIMPVVAVAVAAAWAEVQLMVVLMRADLQIWLTARKLPRVVTKTSGCSTSSSKVAHFLCK
jgi:hypothetical protein